MKRPRVAPQSTVLALPWEADAEEVIVGAIMVNGSLPPAVRRALSPDDFMADRLPGRAYRACLALADRAVPIDPVSVCRQLGDISHADKLRIARMMDGVPKAASIEHHIEAVAEAARKRRCAIAGNALTVASMNGAASEDVDALIAEVAKAGTRRRRFLAANIANVAPLEPRFTVDGFIREAGLHLFWGEPSAYKTWGLAMALCELLLGRDTLFGHPDLRVRRRYRRVLWVGTEENGPVFRSKLDRILAGLGVRDLPGEFIHLWASDPRQHFDLLDLPDLLQTEGPFDAACLDSLTGLRPRMMNGERIKWDLDNDATNALMLLLRGQATAGTDTILVHHTGRERGRYRGPADLWASADVQVGFLPDQGRIRVVVEKNRDGRRPDPFVLRPDWDTSRFALRYGGAAMTSTLTPAATRVYEFVRERGKVTQAEIIERIGCARSTVQAAIDALETTGLVESTGRKVNRSPLYVCTGRGDRQVPGSDR